MERSRSVADKVVLVAGAASGVGRAIAQLFAAKGAQVAATDRSVDGLDAAATRMLDVADPAAITRVVDEISAQLFGQGPGR
ncbi:MAG: SDR family NAD(P)-dependent oxidoreductase [Actinomycetota bacterium]